MSINHIGVIGLGTMGANLARNAARKGVKVSVFNRTTEKMREFLVEYGSEGTFVGTKTLEEFTKSFKDETKAIILMVKAGDAVDDMIEELLPLIAEGDILIDAGNSLYRDTERRQKSLKKKKIHYVGMGVSGGEEGALLGPSIMPGGDAEAVEAIMPVLQKMAAEDGDGGKCVAYMGPDGAGHFVKMVHNGIEYGLMQLIAETYDVLKNIGGASNEELADIYAHWNQNEFRSFLLEITAAIFQKKDSETGDFLVDKIADSAGQKGTGRWTIMEAADLGVPIPAISAATDARILSKDPGGRYQRKTDLPERLTEPYPEGKKLSEIAKNAYELSAICDYAQGFDLLETASKEFKWNLPLAEIARIWRGGCIIRADLLKNYQELLMKDAADRSSLVVLPEKFNGPAQEDWRRIVALATGQGIPVPAISSTLSYYDTIRRPRLPQNLIQAQRDFFGAHTYERIDREGTFHTEWK